MIVLECDFGRYWKILEDIESGGKLRKATCRRFFGGVA
jgi:hypothetical protein